MTRQNARSPRVTFLEKILEPDKDQGNCHPTRNKYTRGHQYSHMERELGLFLNNPGKKKNCLKLIFHLQCIYSKRLSEQNP